MMRVPLCSLKSDFELRRQLMDPSSSQRRCETAALNLEVRGLDISQSVSLTEAKSLGVFPEHTPFHASGADQSIATNLRECDDATVVKEC